MTKTDRLRALRELDLFDTPREKEYDDLVLLATAVCGTPIGLISFLDETRQWCKASVGLEDTEVPGNLSLCTYAMEQSDILIVEDALEDRRFRSSPQVTGAPHLRFYAAVPLKAPGGEPVGALCVIDTEPRQLQESQKRGLVILGQRVENEMSLRLKHNLLKKELKTHKKVRSALASTSDLFFSFMNHGPFASYIKEATGEMVFYNRYMAEACGVSEEEWLGLTDDEIWPEKTATRFRLSDHEVLRTNKAVEHLDVTSSADGYCLFWKTIKFPYTTHDGRRMIAGISMDITEEVMREAALEDALRDKAGAERRALGER